MHKGETGVACESHILRGEVSRLVEAALDVPVVASTGNATVQEAAPLDVRQVMELAKKIDSFVQISRQLDQRLPGTEPVPSIRGASQGRRADLKRKAADINLFRKDSTPMMYHTRHSDQCLITSPAV